MCARPMRHFSRKRTVVGTRALSRRSGSLGPLRRQIQFAAGRPDQRRPDQRGRHAHLTIARLAQRPAVLPLDADRVRALLGKASIVERQDAAAVGNQRVQARPDRRHRPGRVGDEVLQRLVGARIAQAPMHRLHGLALAVVDEARQVATRRIALDTRPKQAANWSANCPKRCRTARASASVTNAIVENSGHSYKIRNIG